MTDAVPSHNFANIRKLLTAAFTAEELRQFCHDRSYFRPIIDRFGPRHGLDDMVEEVITYCETHALADDLLVGVKEVNPRQYARYESQLSQVGPGSMKAIPGTSSGEPAPFLVPFLRNPDFVGRDEDLAGLHDMVYRGGSPVGIRPTVLVGLGGIGKTQLAVEYAHMHRGDYPGGIFWLNAVKPLLFEFANLAILLGQADRETLPERAAYLACTYLDAHPDALVIFDNVENPAALNSEFATDMIPANLRCHTLFTTRQRDFPRGFQPFEVRVLPEEAAMRLLLHARPAILDEHHPDWGIARIVCASLGWLPLALELAASYLGEYAEVTLEGYLERLRAEGGLSTVDDTELHPEDLPTRHEAAVTATLQTQWAQLKDPNARLLFLAAGQFPQATWIPVSRLGLCTGIQSDAGPGRADPLNRAVMRLATVSLIEELAEKRLRLHPLVRQFAFGLAPASLRVEMANHLAQALIDASTLEAQAIQRGIDVILDDVRNGLWLGGPAVNESILLTLERLLDREAHRLRDWDSRRHPVFFLQQVHNRAVSLRADPIASSARAVLNERRVPHLLLRWRGGSDSVELKRTLVGHQDKIRDVLITPDGRRIVSASADGTIRVWDLQTGREEYTLKASLSRYVAIIGSAGKTTITEHLKPDRGEHNLPQGLPFIAHVDLKPTAWKNADVYSLAMAQDGRRLISASADGLVYIWDLETGCIEREITVRHGPVKALRLTPDGSRLVIVSSIVEILDVRTGHVAPVFDGLTANVSPVGDEGSKPLATSGAGAIAEKTQPNDPEQANTEHPGEDVSLEDTLHIPLSLIVGSVGSGKSTLAKRLPTHLHLSDIHKGDLHSRTSDLGDNESQCSAESSLQREEGILAAAITPGAQYAVAAECQGVLVVVDLVHGKLRQLAVCDEDGNPSLPPDVSNPTMLSPQDVVSAREILREAFTQPRTAARRIPMTAEHGLVTSEAAPGPEPMSGIVLTASSEAVLVADARRLLIWNSNDWSGRYLGSHDSPVTAIVLTPNTRRAVSCSQDGVLKIWDLPAGGECKVLRTRGERVTRLIAMPDDRRVISASDEGILRVWDLEAGREERTLRGHSDRITAVAVTPDGNHVVSASGDCTLKVWDLTVNPEESQLGDRTARVTEVLVTPDARQAVSVSHNVKVWDIETGCEKHILGSPEHRATATALTKSGRQMIVASDDGVLREWNLDTGEDQGILGKPEKAVRAIAITPYGHSAILALDDSTLQVWDLRKKQKGSRLRNWTGRVQTLAVTPDGWHVAAMSEDCTYRVWKLRTGRIERSVVAEGSATCTATLAFDAQLAVSALRDGELQAWNLRTGKIEATLAGHTRIANAAALLTERGLVVTVSQDGTVKVWNVRTGRELAGAALDTPLDSVAIAPNGRTILVGDRLGSVYCLEYVEAVLAEKCHP